jgi:hypothetical protein
MWVLKKLIGSPARFLGFLFILYATLTTLIFIEDNLFDFTNSNGWYFRSFTPVFYLIASAIFYVISYLYETETSLGWRPFFRSSLRVIAFCAVLLGSWILWLEVLLSSNHHLISLSLTLGGFVIYIIDYILDKKTRSKRHHVIGQVFFSFLAALTVFLFFMESKAETRFVFAPGTEKEAIIVFGLKGYPPLPATILWKKEIKMPSDGLLLTSDLFEDLPGYRRIYLDSKHEPIIKSQILVEETCSGNRDLIVGLYFTPKACGYEIPFMQTPLQIRYQKIYEDLCKGIIKTHYKDSRSKLYPPRRRR